MPTLREEYNAAIANGLVLKARRLARQMAATEACGWTPSRPSGGLPAPTCARRTGHEGMHHADPDEPVSPPGVK